METRHLTIMFTDIKSFTERTSRSSREDVENLLDLHEQLVIPIVKRHNGSIVKGIGDAFMITFKSPTNAVLCGIAIQGKLKEYNNKRPEKDWIEIRVAINSGEVNLRKNDVFGEPVNVAARIAGISEPNEVYFTESVFLSMNKKEVPSVEIGHRFLKGIPQEIKVYKVLKEGESAEKVKKNFARFSEFSSISSKHWIIVSMAQIVLVAAIQIVGFIAGSLLALSTLGYEFYLRSKKLPIRDSISTYGWMITSLVPIVLVMIFKQWGIIVQAVMIVLMGIYELVKKR